MIVNLLRSSVATFEMLDSKCYYECNILVSSKFYMFLLQDLSLK